MKLFKILAGIILILTGIFCFANPGATFLSLAFLLGCSMVATGFISLGIFYWISRKKETENLILIEGLMNVLLGILVLSDTLISDAAVPLFFGMWVIFSGVLRVAEACCLKSSDGQKRIGSLILGVIGILIGMYAFFNPVLAVLSVVIQTGILFVMQGLNVLLRGFHLPHMKTQSR